MAKTILRHTALVEREKIPIVWRGDIIMAGDGPAGLGTAITVRREGVKVILLGQHGLPGGARSYGARIPLGGAYPELRIIDGIAGEILTKMRNAGPDATDVKYVPLFGDWYFHDSEYFKSMIAKMVVGEELRVRLHTFVSDVTMNRDRRAAGVITESEPER